MTRFTNLFHGKRIGYNKFKLITFEWKRFLIYILWKTFINNLCYWPDGIFGISFFLYSYNISYTNLVLYLKAWVGTCLPFKRQKEKLQVKSKWPLILWKVRFSSWTRFMWWTSRVHHMTNTKTSCVSSVSGCN